MKAIGCALLILSITTSNSAYEPEALDYILRSIEFVASVHSGVFSCVFWDISAQQHYDTIQQAVLESNRLVHTTRYVIKGIHFKALLDVPWNPSMLFIWPGEDVAYLERNDTKENISSSLNLIDPWTKVVIFADLVDITVAQSIGKLVNKVKFRYFVIFDSKTMRTVQCNGVHAWLHQRPPQHMILFNWRRRDMTTNKIRYAFNEELLSLHWNKYWLAEVVRYFYMEAVEVRHNCQGSGSAFFNCYFKWIKMIQQMDKDYPCEIIFTHFSVLGSSYRNTQQLFTTIPLIGEIFVPRDRPLNVAELLMMPFSWQVWTLLTIVLLMSELARRLFPDLFRNDPTLLAVCGFERYNLHRAGSLERILFLSIIILMFFMTNAFETKIVSLMLRKPSIQRIKTLDDLARSDVKYILDLKNSPHLVNDSIFGAIVAHGDDPSLRYNMPGAAVMWYSFVAKLRYELSYDLERMQPFYVDIGYRYFHGIELYWTVPRFILLKAFISIHLKLVEAGLFDFWQEEWRDSLRYKTIGRRRRIDINDNADLKFGDLRLAWTSLTVGLTTSGIVFLAEVIKSRFEKWWRKK